jgi:hypothetical protein
MESMLLDAAGELRCYPVPGRVRRRVAVQQHHRPTVGAMPDARRHIADVDIFELDTFAHELLWPARRRREGRGRPLPTRCWIDPGPRPRAHVDDRLAWP